MSAVVNDAALLVRIEKVFRRVFGPRIAFHAQLERATEPRWTSLKHVEFIIALESEFGVRFDGADATDMVSIPAVCARIAGAQAR
ncbi:MAG TPA: acyl carrier protein [Steroidobacteraceae bacterium]|nr:acyl carrier protein [Steroidobacteraceae bacterium]